MNTSRDRELTTYFSSSFWLEFFPLQSPQGLAYDSITVALARSSGGQPAGKDPGGTPHQLLETPETGLLVPAILFWVPDRCRRQTEAVIFLVCTGSSQLTRPPSLLVRLRARRA